MLYISAYTWLLQRKWLIDSINTSVNTVGSKGLTREVSDHPTQLVISGVNVTESHLQIDYTPSERQIFVLYYS